MLETEAHRAMHSEQDTTLRRGGPAGVPGEDFHCEGIVCENHPDLSWPDQCDCGAGMPSPQCCDPVPQDGTHSIIEAFTPRWAKR